jgi:hypothetical protein
MKIFSPTITGSLGVLGNTILDGNLNVTGGITGSTVYSPSGSFLNLTAVSASFGYLRTVTGSAVIIGDEFIILNADTPVARYAGLIVYDSGSGSPATASFEWDGLTDNWIIQEETGNTAVVLTGPTGSRGSEVLPTTNVLQKGGGHHQLVNSSITDNGTNVVFTTPIAGTSISASSGFLGNLIGTASFATSASFAPSTPAFPFTGSAVITGSLTVTGSISTNNTVSLTGTNKWINSVTTAAYPVGDGLIAVASANAAVNASARYSGIFAATNATIGSGGFMSFILGGDLNDANGIRTGVVGGYNNNVSIAESYIFGGTSNDITGGTAEMIVVGGNNVNITGGTTSIGLGGTNNTISGGSSNAILAGSGNTNNQNRSVIIGGQNITAIAADTVYVPNLDVSGSSTFRQSTVLSGSIRGEVNALSISSNTASLDCALDNFFTLQLVSGSNTFINPSNILPGQTINLRINTTGSATVSFPSSVLQVSGSSYVPTTTTGVDVVTFISFDSTSLLLSNVKNLV